VHADDEEEEMMTTSSLVAMTQPVPGAMGADAGRD
jgi:hypothetical protein